MLTPIIITSLCSFLIDMKNYLASKWQNNKPSVCCPKVAGWQAMTSSVEHKLEIWVEFQPRNVRPKLVHWLRPQKTNACQGQGSWSLASWMAAQAETWKQILTVWFLFFVLPNLQILKKFELQYEYSQEDMEHWPDEEQDEQAQDLLEQRPNRLSFPFHVPCLQAGSNEPRCPNDW